MPLSSPQRGDRNRKLLLAEQRLKKAKEDLWALAEEIQSKCPHPVVIQLDSMPNRRICKVCGYEEVGSHWSGYSVWRNVEGSASLLTQDDYRSIRSNDSEFYAARVEGYKSPFEREKKIKQKIEYETKYHKEQDIY